MERGTARRAWSSPFVVAAIALVGCGHGGLGGLGHSGHSGGSSFPQIGFGGGSSGPDEGPSCMREAGGPLPQAPRDAAVVVFVRSSPVVGAAVPTTIVDREGNFLGRCTASSHFAVTLPPGEHVFAATVNDQVAALRATLAPGKRYYAELGFDFRLTGFKMRFTAVKPGSEAWTKITGALADTKRLERDQTEPWRCGRRRTEEGDAKIQGAIKDLGKLAGADLEEHTLRPEDGR